MRGDLGKAVHQLKREPGKELFVEAVKFALALTELGLIDEYEFVVQPRQAGMGGRCSRGYRSMWIWSSWDRLEFGSGAVTMRYEPRSL